MSLIVAVAGASGYAGGEVLRLVAGHPDLELGPLAAHSSAGLCVGEVHPHLVSLADRTFGGADPRLLGEADLVILALPHGESAALATALPRDVKVVDLGADFRLTDPGEWERYYRLPHAGTWAYGLPELPGQRARIMEATRVAAAGCYPTAVSLALAPLLHAGLVEPADMVVVASSGTSGAGRNAATSLSGTEVMGDLAAYKVAVHQHTPEIRQALTAAAHAPVTLSFTTVLAPMPRGILATATARLRPGVGFVELRAALAAAYLAEPFVALLPEGRWPHTRATIGSNACHLQVIADDGDGAPDRAVVVSAIDNLGKGAAGQAIQIANLMLGLAETAGLSTDGVGP